jgi:hypothetical protein
MLKDGVMFALVSSRGAVAQEIVDACSHVYLPYLITDTAFSSSAFLKR